MESVQGCGGGPVGSNLSSYLVKSASRRWSEGCTGLEGALPSVYELEDLKSCDTTLTGSDSLPSPLQRLVPPEFRQRLETFSPLCGTARLASRTYRRLYTRSHRRSGRTRSGPFLRIQRRRRGRQAQRSRERRQAENTTRRRRECARASRRNSAGTESEGAQNWRDRLGLDQVSLRVISPALYPPGIFPDRFRLLPAVSSSPTVIWTTSPASLSLLRSVACR